jgi:kinesin family protein 5
MDRVRVLCRVRPTTAEEQTRGERVVAIQGAQRLRLQNAAEYVGEHEASWAFDAAYDTDASQAQVYESIQPITQDVLRGFHATVFAYGQTGAGKTHSMFGPPNCSLDGPDAGVVPRLLKDLFAGLTAGDEVRVSCLELYDDLRDLLNEEHRPLKLRENRKDGSVVVDGAVDAVVKDVPATLALLERALVRRVVASHEMNADSSRSHFVASFRVTRPSINASAIMRLVDLAGSERVAKTKATGGTLNEAKRINSSLSALGNVIAALTSSTATHVPYRDSKLTRLLQSSLGGNAKTALLVCVSASSLHAEETVSTLRFGVRAKRVRNAAKVNVDVDDDLLAARLELAALRAERDDAVRERDAAQLQAADKQALLVNERSETTQLRDKIGSLERAEAARKAAEALRAMEDSVRAAAAPPPPDLDAIYDAHAADLASSLASLRLSLQAEARKEAERAALSARNELTSVKDQHAVAQKRHDASVASLKADIARHASDLDALTSDRDRLTDQLSQRDAKIASLRSARAREVEATKGEAAAERAALAQEHEAAVAELRRTQAQALEAARKDAAQELEAARTEAAGALVALNTEAEAQRAAAAAATAELQKLREAHASEATAAAAWERDLAALREKHARELESLRSSAADADALRDAHDTELSKLREAHDAALAKAGQDAATEHAQELAAATKAAAATARQDAKAAEEALMEGHARELEALKKDHAKATEAMQREHDAAMDDKQQRYDAATEEMRKEHAAEVEALGSDAIDKAVAEALEAKARERATKEKELDQSLQWARETHARELANARKEMADAVAAKDAEVRAAQDAHTRLLDAEAKRRADVQKAVEEKEMKLARDHAKKLSRLADDHAKALERRDQEHRAERKQDLVKADESAAKYAEALEAKAREHASLIESLEAKQLKALEEKDERCKEETDAAMEAVEAAQLRANEAEAAARAHEVAAAGLARQLAAAEGRADDLNKGLDALSTEHDTVTKAVVGSRLEGAEAAYEKLRLQVELKRMKKELATAKTDAETARRELREERARPGLLARLKNVVSRERPADIALYPTNTA